MRPGTKKIFRWLLYLTGAVVLFIGGLFLTLQYFFPSSFVISKVESYLKDNYNLGLKIESLDFSLLNGITVEKFTFTDNDMPDSLFSLKSFTLKYDLWPLLDKKLVIEKIIIENPNINVVRNKDGKFNFDGIIEKFAGKDKPPEEPKAEEPAEAGEGAKIVIDLKNFELNDIELNYEDRSPENPMTVKLPLYSLKVSDVSFADMDNLRADISLATGKNNELSFRDKNNTVSFRQELDIKVKAVNEKIDLSFSHDIKGLKLFTAAVNLEDPGDLGIKIEADYDLRTDSLNIDSFDLNFSDMLKIALSGKVTGLTTAQVAEIVIPEIYADVSKLSNFVEKNGLADLAGASFDDSVLKLSGIKIRHSVPENSTAASGNVQFSAVGTSYKQKDISAFVKYLMISSGFDLNIRDGKLLAGSVDLQIDLESVNANVSGKKYSTGRQSLTVKPVLKSDFMPESVKLDYKISDIAEGSIELLADADFDLSDTSIPGLIRNTKAEISLTVDKIHPHIITDAAPEDLFVTLSEELKYAGGIVENTLDVSTEFQCDTVSMYSAADGINIGTYLKADISGHAKERYKLIDFTAKMNDLFSAEIKNVSADLKTMDVSVGKFDLSADLDRLLQTGKATGLEAIKNTRLYNGSLKVSAEGGGNATRQESVSEVRLEMKIDSLFHDEIAVRNGVKVNQTVNLLTKDISLIGGISVKGADYGGMLAEKGIAGDAKIENNIRYTETGEVRILKLGAELPGLETEVNVKGTADAKDSLYAFDLELSHRIGLKESYPIVKGINNIKGSVSGVTKLSGNMNAASVAHTQSLSGISLVLELDSLGNSVRVAGLNAEIPFNAMLDLKEVKLLQYNKYPKTGDFDFLEYLTMRKQHKISGLPVSNLTIDTVAVSHALFKNKIKNIELDIFFDDNKFCLNRFYYELFDGNTAGFMRLDLGMGGFDDIMQRARLDLGLNMTGLNTYYLTRTKTKRSPSTEMNIILKLSSKGLDFINEPDLNGEINLSKLSGDDAKYLLEFLNKNSGDQTAGMVKNMLNAFPGIKVDLFSFTIKNNFLYTLIKLKKPWYLVYFPLAEQISLSKQSIKFYLDKYVREDL